jgi:hypothetical protein
MAEARQIKTVNKFIYVGYILLKQVYNFFDIETRIKDDEGRLAC